MKRFLLLATAILCCVLLIAASPLWARQSILASDGMFWLDILEEGEQGEVLGTVFTAERTLDQASIEALQNGLAYWQSVLGANAANTSPLRILIHPSLIEGNASAASDGEVPLAPMTIFANALANDIWPNGDREEILAYIEIGTATNGWYTEPLTALPENRDKFNLAATIVHELGHALGIGATCSSNSDVSSSNISFKFSSTSFSRWSEGLRDMYGNPARPGMEIAFEGVENENKFVLASTNYFSGAYFTGTNVQEVLDGAKLSFAEDGYGEYADSVPGIPVISTDATGYYDENGNPVYYVDLSHIELQNSLMSHQYWRNWTTFMEAELAVLQDLGFDLDRKAFFGHSIYHDNLKDYVNTNPYYDRQNGQWIEGTPSTTPLGIGLHIYGSNNNVTQAADLLTVGTQAVGIRLEGARNTLYIPETTRIQADGSGGSAILVAYGKGHVIHLAGEATSLGPGGIAARFDFGDNILGNSTEYRGSWMWTDNYGQVPNLSQFLAGPMVSTFNVSGNLLGTTAAIYIDESALVSNINILTGARLQGDIISLWDPENPILHASAPDAEALHTALTFGLAANRDGTAGDPDSGFVLDYSGNILGEKSIDMSLEAGRLNLSGKVEVLSLTNSGYLALNQSVTGSVVEVKDTFTNNKGATLETGFAADGSVTGIQANKASLSGTWALRPMRDYYASGIEISPQAPVVIRDRECAGKFTSVVLLAGTSPILSFESTGTADAPRISVARAPNAYSRLATTSAAHSVGLAMDKIAGSAKGDMQNLVEALDWSGSDGTGVARGLKALGPGAYDAAARASLAQQSEFNLLIMRRMLAQNTRKAWAAHVADRGLSAHPQKTANPEKTGDWQVWATPYGAGSFQGSHSGLSSWKSEGVGLILGAERHFDSGLDFGFHAALAARRTHVQDSEEAQVDTKSAFIGLQALFAPEEWDGFWLTAQGRLGIESGEMDREIGINGYNRQAESRWSGFAGGFLAGLGYDLRLPEQNTLVTVGPLAFFEYSFLQRPGIDEDEGGAASLHVDSAFYDSLLMNLGAHAGFQTALSNGTSLGLDVLAAWRHELLDGNFATSASFRDYGAHEFSSDTELPGRDSLLLQAGLTLATVSDFSAQLEVGGEFFRSGYTALNMGLNLGWTF